MPGKTLLKTTAHRYPPTGHARKGNPSDGLLVVALLYYFFWTVFENIEHIIQFSKVNRWAYGVRFEFGWGNW